MNRQTSVAAAFTGAPVPVATQSLAGSEARPAAIDWCGTWPADKPAPHWARAIKRLANPPLYRGDEPRSYIIAQERCREVFAKPDAVRCADCRAILRHGGDCNFCDEGIEPLTEVEQIRAGRVAV